MLSEDVLLEQKEPGESRGAESSLSQTNPVGLFEESVCWGGGLEWWFTSMFWRVESLITGPSGAAREGDTWSLGPVTPAGFLCVVLAS